MAVEAQVVERLGMMMMRKEKTMMLKVAKMINLPPMKWLVAAAAAVAVRMMMPAQKPGQADWRWDYASDLLQPFEHCLKIVKCQVMMIEND